MKKTRMLVTTAALLALTVVFQYLRLLIGTSVVSTYIIGTLVNLCLIIAAVMVGIWGGLAISVLAPVIALLQGFANIVMLPWIIAGNALLVIGYALFIKPSEAWDKQRWLRWLIVGVIAALVKYAVMSFGMTVSMLMPKQGKAFGAGFVSALTVGQLQQIVTALIAMVLGKLVLFAVPKNMSLR